MNKLKIMLALILLFVGFGCSSDTQNDITAWIVNIQYRHYFLCGSGETVNVKLMYTTQEDGYVLLKNETFTIKNLQDYDKINTYLAKHNDLPVKITYETRSFSLCKANKVITQITILK